jgi:hypothetical protein
MVNKDFIGIDYETTVNAYIQRDITMNVNFEEQIKKHMKKLGYYEVDYDDLMKKNYIMKLTDTIKSELHKDFNSFIRQKTLEEIGNLIDFTDFEDYIKNSMKRKNELNKYIGTSNIRNFYSSLSLQELIYLGY